MECCLTETGKICMEKLIDKALAELRHVFCFTSIANEFKEEKVWLEAKIKTLAQHAKVAAGNDKDIEADYHLWKEKAEKLVQEDILTKQKCFFGLCPNCIWRYKKGKKMANSIQEIKQLIEKRGTFENIEISRRLPDVERYSSKDYISFPSRDSKYKELLDALKDDNNYMIVLQGMGGTGKTTLAKEVGKELKKYEQFAHVIDTTVSFTPDTKKIQDDIAGSLGLKLEDCNDSDRPKKLWSRLTNGEKILLIMDDVWDGGPPLDFDLIGIPKRDNLKGCRVLITTRSKQISNIMGSDKMIELELLSEEEAWTMFKMYAGITNNSSKSLITTGREIAKKCKQLPVAIAVIASSLRGQQGRRHEWNATLKSLKKPVEMDNVDDEKVGVYNCLKVSYDYMKNKKAKGLFLLSSVFPEDKEIPTEILTRLAIGTGLFGEDNGRYDEARNQVVVAKNKLIDSCLLMEVNKEHVKMHDLVREVAQWIANKEIQSVNLSNKDQRSSLEKEINIKYLFCKGKDMDLFSCKYDGSKLETLILDVERDEDRECMEVPNSFFKNFGKLQVLYFSGHDKRPLSLPDSIHSLKNIRSILVDGIDLGDISVFGYLQSLETLDLVDCKINEFPHEIANLGKLKLLNLEDCEIRRNDPFEVIGRCSTLEELYFIRSFNDFCGEITLPEFKRYHIQKGREGIDDSLSKYVSFDADGGECFFSTETFKYIMQTTEGLQLNGIKEGWKNLIELVPIDLGMEDLVELRLSYISQLQCLIDTSGSQVPNILSKLVVLKLDTMEDLVELFNGSLSFDSLKNLEELSIESCVKFRRFFNCKLNLCNLKSVTLQNCPMLVNLFPLLTFQNLVFLEKLKIVYCEGLENIIIEEGSREEIYAGDNDKKSFVLMFPKLKVLEIEGCQLLESILPFLSSQHLPILEVVRIRRCDKLKYVFGQYAELSSLKEIDLCELPNFMGIFQKCSHSISSHVSESSSTSRDSFKAKITVDPIKRNIFPWSCICCHGNSYRHKLGNMSTTKVPSVHEDSLQMNSETSLWERAQCLPIQSHIMCNIKEIKLSGFLKIKSLFVLAITPVMLVETLTISQCDELDYIIAEIGEDERGGNSWGNIFPKLKTLYVGYCKKLEYIFGHYTDDNPTHNEVHLHLPSLQYLELHNLPSLVAICPKQYCTPFPPLEQLDISECPQVAIKSIGELIINHLDSKALNNTITKGSSLHHLQIRDHAQCFQARLLNMCNVKEITLSNILMIKSVLIMPITPTMLVETLTITRCNELKHIIVDIGDDDSGGNNWDNVFPKLKTLKVGDCMKLEYIFGHYTDDHHHHTKIHHHLPALQSLTLENLPNLVAICPKQYCAPFPSLKKLRLSGCSEVAIKSIGEFIIHHSDSESQGNTIMKVSGSIENFIALERLVVWNSKAENIFCLNEIEGRPLNLRLESILLNSLYYMMHLFVGPKNSFALQNLTRITIDHCEILEVVFSTSILRCLSQLMSLTIDNCNELKHIIEDDRQNQNLSLRTCFPKLEELTVTKCPKMKSVFPVSTCKELPKLKFLWIEEADELEEIFKSEGDQKVIIPNLNTFSSTCFPKLIKLSVRKCHKLKYVFPISIYKDLCELLFLEIKEANELEEIFKSEGDQEVIIPNLNSSKCFPTLIALAVTKCHKLKYIFPISTCKELPKLETLEIKGANELEEIFKSEGDQEVIILNLNSSKCFPKLETLFVMECHKLKYVFPISTCKELPKLESLIIKELDELEEIFKCEDDQKVEIPNLNIVVLDNLPSLFHTQGILFQVAKNRLVQNCQNLSLTSASTPFVIHAIDEIEFPFHHDYETFDHIKSLFKQLQEESTKDVVASVGIETEAVLGHGMISSLKLEKEQVMSQQDPVEEIDTTIKPPQGVEEETALTDAKILTTSTHLELISSSQEQDFAVRDSLETAKLNDNQEDRTKGFNTGNKNSSAETTKGFVDGVGIEVEAALEHGSTSSQELEKEQPPSEQQDQLGETDTTIKPSQGVAEGSALTEASTHREFVGSSQMKKQDIDVRGSLETMINNDRVSLNEDVVMKEIPIVLKSKLSPSNNVPMPLAFQAPSMHFEGNPSQKVEDLSSPYLVKLELEELVSTKHLDNENLSLLTDFLVKHPSNLLKDISLSNRYKGFAYNCLVDLLKFLQTHSMLDVLGSSRSKFVQLIHDMRRCDFDKDWLDGVEKRALFPGLQFSQDALQKVSDSKKRVIKDVEVVRFKIDILTQNVEELKQQLSSSEADLEIIIQQEKEIVESMAALSAPLGY